MAINWSKVGSALRAFYNAFLKGKTVKVGGTTVVLPSEGNVPPLRGSKFDSTPHKPEPPAVGPRR